MDANQKLEISQNEAAKVEERMLNGLMEFSPCHELKVSDILYIARMARGFAFDATRQALGM